MRATFPWSGRSSGRPSLALLLTLLLGACGPPSLANTYPSKEALAREVLAAIQGRDSERLRALAIDEREFDAHIWPSLPAARPERNLPATYVWKDLHQKSELGLRRALNEHGGKRYDLEAVRFGGDTTPYAGYTVHRETILTVKASGTSAEIRVMGSLVEQGGRWKVFSYVSGE